jgi:dolichol-phosphate mannosyltransferase
MPAYNEEESVERVVEEWLPALRGSGAVLRFLAIDDGSRDRTLERLRRASDAHPEVEVRSQPNRGHGAACRSGYRAALEGGADWIFQLDSDGQCDARYFAALWRERERYAAVFANRRRRDDGWTRWLASRVLSLVVAASSRVWVADSNVPYRLMRRDALAAALQGVPEDFELFNVLLAVRLARRGPIGWVPIRFRARHGGEPSVRLGGMLRRGATLAGQLRNERRSTMGVR